MQRASLEFLQRLMNTISPSGYEEEAARVWLAEAEAFADRTWTDQHGNAYALVQPGGSPRVMFAGHMDEIGLMITHIDENGFLYFTSIGGWDPQILQGQRVWVRTKAGRVTGVIGKKPVHLIKQEERDKVTKLEDLWIDIGAKNNAEAQQPVSIGDPVVLAYGFEEFQNGLALSRGFDDKAGAFVVLEAARLLAQLHPKAEIYAVATVQEEIGLRGARTSAFGIDPKVAIAVDVEFATDFPSMEAEKKRLGAVQMGGGPVIVRGANINPKVFELLVETAQDRELPHQIVGIPGGTGTDANAIQLSRSGVATGLIGVPNRYMHSPCELVSLDDLENAAQLIAQFTAQIHDEIEFTPIA
jgi:putative aminopeptidase FrvX